MVESLYRRLAETPIRQALADSPVVLLHGPRQCGKTTLARVFGHSDHYAYETFDDDTIRAAAKADPIGFVADLPDHCILDEVQRVPELFTTIKKIVDRDRRPGRILLTGSADVMFVPSVSDSLAGRLESIRLHPLAQCEIVGSRPRFLDELFAGRFESGEEKRVGRSMAERITTGGYPAAIARKSSPRRSSWYRNYIDSLVQRDVRDLTRISTLEALPRLLTFAAGQTARLLNISDLAAPFQLTRPTIRQYLTILERVFLVEQIPPWHRNRLSRLVKAPKLHVGDTGLACALLGVDADGLLTDRSTMGQMLETFVFQELRRQASWRSDDVRFHHFRDKDGGEVDIVLEHAGGGIFGVEVKAGATVTAADFRGLRRLREAAGDEFRCGALLYDGESVARFGPGMFAVPLSRLW